MPTTIVSGPQITITILPDWILSSQSIQPGKTIDLKPTLPAGAPAGGTFALASGSLAAGVTLSAAGIISVASNAAPSTSSNLTFNYTGGGLTFISSPPITLTVLASWTLTNISIEPGQSYDLKPTLPAGTATGGTFALATGSLPAGMSLGASTGLLTVAVGSVQASTTGVSFSYTYGSLAE